MIPSGTKAVIIGNGGSLDLMPPAFWEQDCLYIGTNRALCIIALQGVRLDAVVIRDTYRNLWGDPDVGWHYHKDHWIPYGGYKVGPAHTRTAHCDEFVRMEPGWQFVESRDENREAAVIKNSCVVMMACNVAWHWGVREFQLIGVDYYGRHAAMLEGYEVSTGNEWRYERPVQPCIEWDFGVMRQAIETGGGSIVNCSQHSRLKAIKYGYFGSKHNEPKEQSGPRSQTH